MRRVLVGLAVLVLGVLAFSGIRTLVDGEQETPTLAPSSNESGGELHGDGEPLYCVREGNPTSLEGCDYVVDRIEDVPKGAVWAPSHGGLEDPEEIRRFWCLDYEGSPQSNPRQGCEKYYRESE